MRIAVGGFQHETNTFASQKAALADFEMPDAWPGLTRGAALFAAVRGINLPVAGFVDAAEAARHSLLPLSWCSASPSGPVTRNAYEHIVELLLTDLRACSHVDAVYLDLHGAMVAEHVDDADGELLQRVRSLVGPRVPVVASLDFHANVSPLMVRMASALVAYRTYPHVDMAETGERALRCLQALAHRPLTAAMRKLPFLIPLTSQCTLIDPLAALIRRTAQRETAPNATMNFTPGFPAADVAECGPTVFGYGADAARVERDVGQLAEAIVGCEAEFALEIYSIDAAMRALLQVAPRGRPIILADTQDNPGGGGTADSTSLLKALLAARTQRVLAGVFCDAEVASIAHQAGVGAQIDLALGAKSGVVGESPLQARFTVIALGDGRFTATGPFYRGSRMELGPMTLLRLDDIYIAVSSRKQQAADQAMFRHLGVEPSEFAVLALKSSVHFRADFGALASSILVVDAPGVNIADPARLPFRKLPPQMRVSPRS